ncbi:hypothetical protein D515_02674 [Grimontia indica]|uniref:Outer membrane protein beta-barrel domain-containing protein n=1 Tax=Grimontia indica TaxID=1056512 RepID=R1IMH9_9GAMM|nr:MULTISPECIES: hypothetical protein [Grimontia]EOD78682.1 hypothetical protein D515_02674 [Grimontia indica]
MKKLVCSVALAFSSMATADIHFSPDLKIGMQWGLGAQLGVNDVMGFEAVYGSFGIADSYWFSDKESVKHYRLGVQYLESKHQAYSVQLEAGIAEYKGTRNYFGRDREDLKAYGPSVGAALVFDYNLPIKVRYGLEMGYFRHQDTFLPSGLAPQLNVGVILPL